MDRGEQRAGDEDRHPAPHLRDPLAPAPSRMIVVCSSPRKNSSSASGATTTADPMSSASWVGDNVCACSASRIGCTGSGPKWCVARIQLLRNCVTSITRYRNGAMMDIMQRPLAAPAGIMAGCSPNPRRRPWTNAAASAIMNPAAASLPIQSAAMVRSGCSRAPGGLVGADHADSVAGADAGAAAGEVPVAAVVAGAVAGAVAVAGGTGTTPRAIAPASVAPMYNRTAAPT